MIGYNITAYLNFDRATLFIFLLSPHFFARSKHRNARFSIFLFCALHGNACALGYCGRERERGTSFFVTPHFCSVCLTVYLTRNIFFFGKILSTRKRSREYWLEKRGPHYGNRCTFICSFMYM